MSTASSRDSLGDRMKGYERAWRTQLNPRSWVIVRLDGRAFHTWCKGLPRPYSVEMITALGESMQILCEQTPGAAVGFCQSDEVTVVLTDFAREDTQAFYGGQVQKIVSVMASTLTAYFGRHFPDRDVAIFDARAFVVPARFETMNQIYWRQSDCRRNSISMLCEGHYTEAQLHGVSTAQRTQMLADAGVDLTAVDPRFLNGQVCYRSTESRDIRYTEADGSEKILTDVTRRPWVLAPAPTLDAQPGTLLDEVLPHHPDDPVITEETLHLLPGLAAPSGRTPESVR